MRLTAKHCADLLNKWPISLVPEYRRYTCASCGRTMVKAWHIHFIEPPYKREFHLCQQCGKHYDLDPKKAAYEIQ